MDVAQVRRLQARLGVSADGILGPATWAALWRALGVDPAPVSDPTEPPASTEPAWLVEARSLIGQREIAGPKHNSRVVQFFRDIGASWFNDDETPWCGAFVGHCMRAVGLPVPAKGEGARALSWASYGHASAPQVGAIGVKSRDGGGHVFFIVGETADRRFLKALGGNQGNEVSIVDIPKASVVAMRWPDGVPEQRIPLPIMPAGKMGASEA